MKERKTWLGGNWKCNGTSSSITSLCEKFQKCDVTTGKLDVVICPSPVHVSMTKAILPKGFQVGSQNVSKTGNGAFTGETSCEMLEDMGVEWTLVGHSERRQYYGESDQVVGDKVDYLFSKSSAKNLKLVICIGELLEEREKGETESVCERQLKAFVKKVSDWSRVVVAYEPVWAIGTGKVATPAQAQEVHAHLRSFLEKEVDKQTAQDLRIVYGGSVSKDNCDDLIAKQDIDGFLVGGASLKEDFVKIIETCTNFSA